MLLVKHKETCTFNALSPVTDDMTKETESKIYFIEFNSLAPGKFEWNFRHVIFKQILVIDDWGISCEIALK